LGRGTSPQPIIGDFHLDASELPFENGNHTIEGVANAAYRTSITRGDYDGDNGDNALSMCIHFTRPNSADLPSGLSPFPGDTQENRYLLQIATVGNTGSGANNMFSIFWHHQLEHNAGAIENSGKMTLASNGNHNSGSNINEYFFDKVGTPGSVLNTIKENNHYYITISSGSVGNFKMRVYEYDTNTQVRTEIGSYDGSWTLTRVNTMHIGIGGPQYTFSLASPSVAYQSFDMWFSEKTIEEMEEIVESKYPVTNS